MHWDLNLWAAYPVRDHGSSSPTSWHETRHLLGCSGAQEGHSGVWAVAVGDIIQAIQQSVDEKVIGKGWWAGFLP